MAEQSLASEPALIGAALHSIYIVLGVLYESLIHPITIISSLPSAGLGALLAVLVTGTDFGVMSVVGIVLLMGIVKKNAIMLVDFASTPSANVACHHAMRSARRASSASDRSS